MQITVAKRAGFCFGVARAVRMLEQEIEAGSKVATLGPIIHNPQLVERFAEQGVKVVENAGAVPPGYKAVIRSHGVAAAVIQDLEQREIPYLNATCPYVTKIHRIVADASREGRTVLIAGDHDHPEIQGIIGHCTGVYAVFSNADAFLQAIPKERVSVETSYILVAQTTFNLTEWQKCVRIAKKLYTNILLFDTICKATSLRQNETRELAQKSDAMLVVGGRQSSNTAKLAQICQQHGPTFWVETADELKNHNFEAVRRLGVTAGASTPAFIIKEVQTTMSELQNQQEQQEQQDEMSFEEMLDQSFKTISAREKVSAVVTGVTSNEIAVDIGTKHAGYVPLEEFTDDPDAKLDELVEVGEELELIVLRVNDMEGTAMLSKKRLDAIAGFEKVVEAEQNDAVLEGVVVNVVKGGVIALSNSVRIFIPASQATASRGQALETLLKQTVQFKILETNRQRRRAVGSIRAVLKERRKALAEQFWQEVEVGKKYKGVVKSLTSYGAFVDLGGVDGMAHISELSWSRIKHPSEVVSVDDEVEVYVKEIDRERERISLGYKKEEDNPWEILSREYKTGDVCKVNIVSMTVFGAFAQVIPGVDGLIHISQIANERVAKPSDVLSIGQEVDVKITDIDFDRKRVSLSIRALLEDETDDGEDNVVQVREEEPPSVFEAGPDFKAEVQPGEEEATADSPQPEAEDSPQEAPEDSPQEAIEDSPAETENAEEESEE